MIGSWRNAKSRNSSLARASLPSGKQTEPASLPGDDANPLQPGSEKGRDVAKLQADDLTRRERRQHERVSAAIVTEVFEGATRCGFAWMKNLSEGGGLLRWRTTVRVGSSVRLVLRPANLPLCEIDADVLETVANGRTNSLGTRVAFRSGQETTREALRSILSRGSQNALRRNDHGILIVGNDIDSDRLLGEAMAILGHHPIFVRNPLDAIVWLQDGATAIDAACAAEQCTETPELLSLLKDEFPQVRRVLLVTEGPRQGWVTKAAGLVDVALTLPTSPPYLARALG